MKNYIQEGKVIPYKNAGSAILSGAPVAISGVLVGVATGDIAATTGEGHLAIEGVFELPKATGGGSAITAKKKVYFDGTNITLTPDDIATITYDGTTARWRATSRQA